MEGELAKLRSGPGANVFGAKSLCMPQRPGYTSKMIFVYEKFRRNNPHTALHSTSSMVVVIHTIAPATPSRRSAATL
eukprot:COSAG02_NODE_7625_length_2927_cov_14.997171_2_plen_77_part_00